MVDINIYMMVSSVFMRTTLNLDDEVLELVRIYAESRSLPLGKAVSDLVRKGLRGPARFKTVDGLCVVDLPPNSPRVTSEHVKKLESEME